MVDSSEGDARDLLDGYAQTYLREVQAESVVRSLGGFGRFQDVIAAPSGERLNALAIARDPGVATRTVRDYVQVLEDTLLGFRLEAWRRGIRSRLVAHTRLDLFDLGVTNALNRRLTAQIDPVTRERLFEQWFILECRRWVDYSRSEVHPYFSSVVLWTGRDQIPSTAERYGQPLPLAPDLFLLRAGSLSRSHDPRVSTRAVDPRR